MSITKEFIEQKPPNGAPFFAEPNVKQISTDLPLPLYKRLRLFVLEKDVKRQDLLVEMIQNHIRWTEAYGDLAAAKGLTVPALMELAMEGYLAGELAKNLDDVRELLQEVMNEPVKQS